MQKELAVVLLSAGMDSAVCASVASLNFRLALLHVQYGQRTALKELECFYKLCAYFQPEKNFVASAMFLKEIGASSLTDESKPIPEKEELSIPSTYVPFRNGIFLSIATAWAEAIEPPVFLSESTRLTFLDILIVGNPFLKPLIKLFRKALNQRPISSLRPPSSSQ